MKQSPKPPIVRDNIFGKDDPAHQTAHKLDAGHNGAPRAGSSLRKAARFIPKN